MKLIDKFKNLFTEEVEEDVNIEIKDSKPKVEVIKETIRMANKAKENVEHEFKKRRKICFSSLL